jgi:hypothetical protein
MQDGAVGGEDLFTLLAATVGAAQPPHLLVRAVRSTLERYDGDGDGLLTVRGCPGSWTPKALVTFDAAVPH